MTRRTASVAAIGALIVLVAGCQTGTETTSSQMPSSSQAAPTSVAGACPGEAPVGSELDGVLDDLPSYEVTRFCPADFDPALVDATQFTDAVAGDISSRGRPVQRVFVGDVSSGNGDAFVRDYLAGLSEAYALSTPPRILASGEQDLGGRPVTYFNVPVAVSGYAYAQGPTVVIATLTGDAEAGIDATGTDNSGPLFTILSKLPNPLGAGNYTTASDPGWVFFGTEAGQDCGIGPAGAIFGCDNASAEAPPGTNQTVVIDGAPAVYRYSDTPTFTRDVDVLPDGHRLVHDGVECTVGLQGTVSCETADGRHGFTIAGPYGELR